MSWTPDARPPWARSINEGRWGGPDHPSRRRLNGEELLAEAVDRCGLDDFGDGSFRAGYDRFVEAAEDEADLHPLGRWLTRRTILRLLVNRLRIVQAAPAVAAPVVAPIVVTGTGRSGTSILHELLAQDPALRAPLTWECWEPLPRSPGEEDWRRVRRTHVDVTRWDRIAPSYRTMHENGALIPQECIFLTNHEFASDDLGGRYTIPSYSGWLAGADLRPAYRMHRTVLGLLQGDDGDTRWVLKAPSHLSALPALFDVYPDARLVVTHRDPLRVLGSIASLMATLRWINSDRVDHDGLVALMAMALPYLLDNYMAQVDDGTVPAGQVADVRYADLLDDPMAAVGSVYETFDLPFTDDARDRMERYLAARPQGRHGTHRYSFDDLGLDRSALRAQVAEYQARFAVPDET